jgi:signal transduction histidine kinase/tetratricopeptide (TPR) repeat protein
MEIFVLNEGIVKLDSVLLSARDAARLEVLVQLAWHFRQRDSVRALALAAQAKDLLHFAAESRPYLARLQLVWGEVHWLMGELDVAEEVARNALAVFTILHDPTGMFDAHWLLASIAADRGNTVEFDAELDQAQAAARCAGDALREQLSQAFMARSDVLREVNSAEQRWKGRFDPDAPGQHPALSAYIVDFLAFLAVQRGDFGLAIRYFIRGQELALLTGQIRICIGAMTNAGNSFSNLNDHHMALEWMQRGVELSRSAGWPARTGVALMQIGETLRLLGQLDAAQEILDEALVKMAPLAGSHNYSVCLTYLADLQLAQHQYDKALVSFGLLQKRADALSRFELHIDSRRGQAHALSCLGQTQEALRLANEALSMAIECNDTSLQMQVLRVLADIYARQNTQQPALESLTEPNNMTAASPALHYLLQALEVASTIKGYIVPGDLLDALGHEYARMDDYEQAYSISLQAITAREKIHSQEATNRAIAMQVRYQTENAQAEGEHHRQLAESEARRAEVLQQTSRTLERLSVIGQEITAHLDMQAVFQALNIHVHGLLDASVFAVYLTQEDGITMRCVSGVEAGQALKPPDIRIDDPKAYTARCARERSEVAISLASHEDAVNLIPGTLLCMSKLFAPLMLGERVLGVMTIQTPQANAYAERERFVFRSLAAYGAIAVNNADAYQKLQQAQSQLVAREKLAALGGLVAGVAHELNTPVGNSLHMATNLQEKTDVMNQKMRKNSLDLQELEVFLADSRAATGLIMHGLKTAADLVNSFKQVAVKRTSAERRVFDLQQACHEIVATMMNQIRSSGHSISIEIPDNIAMTSYLGPFGQVLASFISNSLRHAFPGRSDGKMSLSVKTGPAGRVQLQFKDDGIGISEQDLTHIFDPFFTAKIGQGGSGLGLSISNNIVTSVLHGRIIAWSKLGEGTALTLDLPLSVPDE